MYSSICYFLFFFRGRYVNVKNLGHSVTNSSNEFVYIQYINNCNSKPIEHIKYTSWIKQNDRQLLLCIIEILIQMCLSYLLYIIATFDFYIVDYSHSTGGRPIPAAELFPPSRAKLAPYTALLIYGVGKWCTTQQNKTVCKKIEL
jgi:hypothetical protein